MRLVGIVMLGLLLTFLVGACGSVVSDLQTVGTAGDNFMTALKNGDASGSYNMLGADLQKEIGGADSWATWIKTRQAKTWNFANRNINNERGELSGTATFSDDKDYNISLVLTKSGSDWKVIGIQFNLK